MEILVNVSVFFIGSVIGSFLNVCIYRLPRGESIVFPSSHCVHCGNGIPWHDNIPFLSYLFLRGRCRFCARPISKRYFMVELLTGSVFFALYAAFGFTAEFFVYAGLASALIVSSFIDLEHQLIPDAITLTGIACGLIIGTLLPGSLGAQGAAAGFLKSLLGAAAGGSSIYILGFLGELIFRKEAMGGGDVKLMAMIGAFLGYKLVLLAFFIAPFFGAAAGIAVKLKEKKSVIPYGPHLSLAALVSIFWGERILSYLFFY